MNANAPENYGYIMNYPYPGYIAGYIPDCNPGCIIAGN
jgi:hypothetical protein